jgi:hypothetical protein
LTYEILLEAVDLLFLVELLPVEAFSVVHLPILLGFEIDWLFCFMSRPLAWLNGCVLSDNQRSLVGHEQLVKVCESYLLALFVLLEVVHPPIYEVLLDLRNSQLDLAILQDQPLNSNSVESCIGYVRDRNLNALSVCQVQCLKEDVFYSKLSLALNFSFLCFFGCLDFHDLNEELHEVSLDLRTEHINFPDDFVFHDVKSLQKSINFCMERALLDVVRRQPFLGLELVLLEGLDVENCLNKLLKASLLLFYHKLQLHDFKHR